MTCYPFWKKNRKNILHIGTAGGFSKASTGFTFKNVHKNTGLIIDYIKKEQSFTSFKKKNKYWFYDLLLLDILDRENHLGSQLFATMFKKNKTDKIFKFLDDETSFTEDLKIMSTMPSFKFMKAIFRRIYR
jgi:lycopene beta-cyclase